MKVAIMQPYTFPYIGYFQLIQSCDIFVFLDNVQYINKGWINRNYILVNGKKHLFSIPLKKKPQNELIKNCEISPEEYPKFLTKFTKRLDSSYFNTTNYSKIKEIIDQTFNSSSKYITHLAQVSITNICRYLNIKRKFYTASELLTDQQSQKLTGEQRIIEILHIIGGTKYINPISGSKLYSKELFASNHLNLAFLKSMPLPYLQKSQSFIPDLSVIDVLMNNDLSNINNIINHFQILKA